MYMYVALIIAIKYTKSTLLIIWYHAVTVQHAFI